MLYGCIEGARHVFFWVYDGGAFSFLANYTIVICWYDM